MTDLSPIETTSLDRFGNAALPWSRARDLLAHQPQEDNPGGDHTTFLGSTRPDGRPHSTPVGALWVDGDLFFTSNLETRKSRNLAANPADTISVRLPGIDVVLEGTATRETDPAVLADVAARYRAGGWPAQAEGDALTAPFSAPSAGPPPWYLYRFTFHTAFGVATAEPWGATRWRFAR